MDKFDIASAVALAVSIVILCLSIWSLVTVCEMLGQIR
jgi:hypothetical protein